MTSHAYAALSQWYAGRGDLRMAQLAAWAADVHTLEDLLRENGLDQAPDPGAQLAAIGQSIAASLEQLADQLAGTSSSPENAPRTARDVVDMAREAMVTTFDESVHGLLSDRLGDLEHLDHVDPVVAADPTSTRTAARLEGRSAAELAAELRSASSDCTAMGDLLGAEGDVRAAARLFRQADAASYEAYLVLAAIRSGDSTFATVDLRWELMAHATAPGERPRFVTTVGVAERGSLEAALETA